MSDTYTEKTGFLTNMKNSITGVFVGIILIIVGIGVLIYNERKNTINIKDVKELRDTYTDIKSDTVDKEYDGKLISTSNTLTFADEELKDTVFNISKITPLLTRTVEVYQWEETEESSGDETTYKYDKKWSNEIIDSSKFKQESGHENPKNKAYDDTQEESKELKVGAYRLSNAYRSYINANNEITDLTGATIPEGYKTYNKYITNSKDTSNPEVGDVRISFNYASYDKVTVLGEIKGDLLDEYTTKKKSKIVYLVEGEHDGAYVIDEIEKNNNIWKWVLRLIGTLLVICGFTSFFGPISTLTSYVPFFGKVVKGVTGILGFLIGLAVSLLVIAISWIVFRPVLGICLLVAVVLLILLAKKITAKKQ